MAQVKKETVRVRIIKAAAKVFEKNGYVGSSMGQIAAAANQSVANIYNYFPSKLHVAFAVFEPWITKYLDRIESEASRKRDPRERLAHTLAGLWRDIPRERNNFFNNFIQAIATTTPKDGYTPTILFETREHVLRMVLQCLPAERRMAFDAKSFAHMAVMTFDGFVINSHLDPKSACTPEMIETACSMILGERVNGRGARHPRTTSTT